MALVDAPHPAASPTDEEVLAADGTCRHPPEWVILCVNNACNLKCRTCDVGLGDRTTPFWANMIGPSPANMPIDLLETTLDQALAFQPIPRIGLAFTEPLLHPRIAECVKAVRSRGFFCSLTTGGYLLPARAEALVEAGLDQLIVSVDGPAPLHDLIRGRAGSYARIVEGTARIVAARKRLGTAAPVIDVSVTIGDLNYGALCDTLAALEPIQPSRVVFAHLSFITLAMAAAHNARWTGDLRVTPSCLGPTVLEAIDPTTLASQVAAVLERAREPGAPAISFHPDLRTPAQIARYYRQPEAYVGGRRCTDPFTMLMVQTDGTVVPAHSRCYAQVVGNVRATPLAALWNAPRFVEFRQVLASAGGSLPACTRCCGVVGKPPIWK